MSIYAFISSSFSSQIVAFDAEGLSDFFQFLIDIHENGPPSSLFRKRPGKSRYVSSASYPVCGVPATARRPPISRQNTISSVAAMLGRTP